MASNQWRRPKPKPAPKPRKPPKDGTYVMDNATANMMADNPGMSREEARELALAKLVAALKAAYGETE